MLRIHSCVLQKFLTYVSHTGDITYTKTYPVRKILTSITIYPAVTSLVGGSYPYIANNARYHYGLLLLKHRQLKSTIFWDVALRSMVEIYGQFRVKCKTFPLKDQ